MKPEDDGRDTRRQLACGCYEYLMSEDDWRPMHVDGCGTIMRRKIATSMEAKSKAAEDILDVEYISGE